MRELYDEGKTIREIAEICKVSTSYVVRSFKKNGKELRSKSDAGRLAYENGKIFPPTTGKKRSKSEKDRIARGRAAAWKGLEPEAREAFRNAARERWESWPDEKVEERQRLAGEALSVASKEGSKLEKFMYEFLTKEGYRVILHKKGLIAGEKYEIDLYLPDQRIAIEIDGPQHFLPIFGEDRLQRTIKYDEAKNGTLVSHGLCVVRLKFLLKFLSDYAAGKICKGVLEEIKKIEKKFPPKTKRVIELETDFE